MGILKLKQPMTISIPVGNSGLDREIACSNADLASVLLKRNDGELMYYNVPDATSDIFRRRILVKRISKKDVSEDSTDLVDVHHTDLPWIGHMTFNQAHRQFRSRYALAGVVEMVRLIDGFLWNLTIDTGREIPEMPLKLVSYETPGVLETHYVLTVDRALDACDLVDHFHDVPEIPPTLLAEMTQLGYLLEGNVFHHPQVVGLGSRIVCTLWGKLNAPKVPHLKAVS